MFGNRRSCKCWLDLLLNADDDIFLPRRDVAASRPNASSSQTDCVWGAMLSALDGMQQQQRQQQGQQEQAPGALPKHLQQQQAQQSRHLSQANTQLQQAGAAHSLQQQAARRQAIVQGWHSDEAAAAAHGFETQRSGSAPLPSGHGRWGLPPHAAAPQPPPLLHCSSGIVDTSLGAGWQQPAPQQQPAAAGFSLADFGSLPSMLLSAPGDATWAALEQDNAAAEAVAAHLQQLPASLRPPSSAADMDVSVYSDGDGQPAASHQTSITEWADTGPRLGVPQGWAPLGMPAPLQQTLDPVCGGCRYWNTCCIEGGRASAPAAQQAQAAPPLQQLQQHPTCGGCDYWNTCCIEQGSGGDGCGNQMTLAPSLAPPGSCGDLAALNLLQDSWHHDGSEVRH